MEQVTEVEGDIRSTGLPEGSNPSIPIILFIFYLGGTMNLKGIKDAARQAFKEQQLQDTEGGVPDAVSFCAGFLAGARHILHSTKEDMLLKEEYIVVKNVDNNAVGKRRVRSKLNIQSHGCYLINDDLLYYYIDYELMQEQAKYLPELEEVK